MTFLVRVRRQERSEQLRTAVIHKRFQKVLALQSRHRDGPRREKKIGRHGQRQFQMVVAIRVEGGG